MTISTHNILILCYMLFEEEIWIKTGADAFAEIFDLKKKDVMTLDRSY